MAQSQVAMSSVESDTAIGDLPNELHFAVAAFLGQLDFLSLRCVNKHWEAVGSYQLTKVNLTMTLDRPKGILDFNDTFLNPDCSHLDLKNFSLKLPLLATRNCASAVTEFAQSFGPSMKTLSLDYGPENYLRFDREQLEGTRQNFATLLGQVTETIEELHLKDFKDSVASTFNWTTDPSFQSLRRLKLTLCDETLSSDHFLIGRNPQPENFVHKLSERLSNLSQLEIGATKFGYFSRQEHVTRLADTLRNFTSRNPQVHVTIHLGQHWANTVTWADIFQALGDIPMTLVNLSVDLNYREREALKFVLDFVETKKETLQILTLKTRIFTSGNLYELPVLPVLEKLTYEQNTYQPVLTSLWSSRFVNLEKLAILFHESALTGSEQPFPKVKELTFCIESNTFHGQPDNASRGNFYVRMFPNLETLTCVAVLLEYAFPFEFQKLKNLNITRPSSCWRCDSDYWRTLTWEPTRPSYEQILGLTPAEDGNNNAGIMRPPFKKLTQLRQLELTVPGPGEAAVEALIYLSQTGKLQRLTKLKLNITHKNYDDEILPEVQIQELKGHHAEVILKELNIYPNQSQGNF